MVIGNGKKALNDGSLTECSFSCPQGMAYHPSGVLYVADTENHCIRKVRFYDMNYIEDLNVTFF